MHALQTDIQNLKMPSENVEASTRATARYASSPHTALARIADTKDKLLKILHEHPDWQPHDIAVLTPNIEPYTPFIEAVFGQAQPGAQALPYSVSDVKISRKRPFYALGACPTCWKAVLKSAKCSRF